MYCAGGLTMNCGLAKKDFIVHRRSLIICRSSEFLIFLFGNFVRCTFSSQELSSHITFRKNLLDQRGVNACQILALWKSLTNSQSSLTVRKETEISLLTSQHKTWNTSRMLNILDLHPPFPLIAKMILTSGHLVFEHTPTGLNKKSWVREAP